MGSVRRAALGDDDVRGPEQPVLQLVPLAQLAQHRSLRLVRAFLLRDGFVQIRVERLARGVDGFDAQFPEKVVELGETICRPAKRGDFSSARAVLSPRSKLSRIGMRRSRKEALEYLTASSFSRAARLRK